MRYKRNSKTLKLRNRVRAGTVSLLLLLFFSGCASHPWGELVDEQHHSQLQDVYQQIVYKNRDCSSAYDGELVATLDTRVKATSMSGYFRLLNPTYVWFVVNNPLGQPLFGLVAQPDWFQVLNIPDKTYSLVSHRHYALKNDIPLSFLKGNWFDWVTGRPLSAEFTIMEIRNDQELRGAWYSIGTADDEPRLLEHVLVDVENKRLLERVIVDMEGTAQANLLYRDWDRSTGCELPMSISVTGLSFGARADLALSDIQPVELRPKDFRLPHPQGFVKKIMP